MGAGGHSRAQAARMSSSFVTVRERSPSKRKVRDIVRYKRKTTCTSAHPPTLRIYQETRPCYIPLSWRRARKKKAPAEYSFKNRGGGVPPSSAAPSDLSTEKYDVRLRQWARKSKRHFAHDLCLCPAVTSASTKWSVQSGRLLRRRGLLA